MPSRRTPKANEIPASPPSSSPSAGTRSQRVKRGLRRAKSEHEWCGRGTEENAASEMESLENDRTELGTDGNCAQDATSAVTIQLGETVREKGQYWYRGDFEEEQPLFPFLELPAELRLHIYRACLTRDYNIKLSKVDKPKPVLLGTEAGPIDHQSIANEVPLVVYPSARSYGEVTTFNASPPPSSSPSPASSQNGAPENPNQLSIALLRTSKTLYKEAREILYKENTFDLDIYTAVGTFARLPQRSRRVIQHVELTIPTQGEILEHFSDVVRLSLRYCAGLKTLVIRTPFDLPGTPGASVGADNSTVFAKGFEILRWLPQQCEVVLDGWSNPEIDKVVAKHLALAKTQDKVAYAKRQLFAHDEKVSIHPIVR